MKPIKLTMQSFGSYGEKNVIDFTRPEQNLFLITGDTGSGKSTIFDAIVFALYGETSSGVNKKSGKELQSQFSDGMKGSFVELVFTEKHGTEIKEYTVRREPRQTRISASGRKVDSSEKVTLILPDNTALSQKDANAKLSEIVVLTKNQFMQISMIAQGEFMELLRASSNDKKKILRKLFNTEIFEKIVGELKNRRKITDEQIKYIRSICQTEATHIIIPKDYENAGCISDMKNNFLTGDISAYSMENFVENIAELCKHMKNRKVSAEKEYNKAFENSVEKRDALKNARSLLKTFGEMERAEKEISECEKAEPDMKYKNDLIQKINSAYEIQAVYNRYADISVSAEDVRKKFSQQKEILPVLETEYKRLVDEERQALEMKNSAMTEFAHISERVKNNLEIFEKISRAENDISEKKLSVSETEKRAESIIGKFSELEKNIADCQKDTEELSGTDKLLIEWQVRNDETERISGDYTAVVGMCNEIVLQKKKTEKYQSEYISAREKYISCMNEYTAKRTAFLDAQAGFIAKEKLRDGQPCPVCGSLDHPFPCELSEIHSSITREVIERLTAEVSELDNIQNKKSAQANSAMEIFREREKILNTAMVNLRERMAKIIPDVSENPDTEQIGEILSVWKSHITEEGKVLSEKVKKYRKASELLGKYSEEKNNLVPELEKINNSLSELQSEISGNLRLKKELTESLYYTDEVSAHKALSVAEVSRNRTTIHYNSVSSKLDSVRKNLEQAKILIQKYGEELPELEKTRSERKSEYISIVEKYSLTEWQDITEKFPKDYTEILRSEINLHSQRKLSAQTAYNLSRKTIGNNCRPDIDALEKADISAVKSLETAQEKLEICKEIYKTDSDTYKLLSEQTGNYSRLSNAYENLNRLCNRLSGTASGEHIGIETFVQRYYLQRILDGANVHFQRMSGGQFELRLISEQQASSSGRTERGLELTVYSAVTDSEREVNTLSGGETFMAALALALGMSEQIQENATSVNPDIMFIDEGFGSLDEHSRNQAVKVLKEMAEENRFIGIISHVTEMKQEIDSQLVVTKDKKGSHTHWVIS